MAFRVDADALVGMGHLVRCLNLAHDMAENLGVEAKFLLSRRSVLSGADVYVRGRGFAVHVIPASDGTGRDHLGTTRRLLRDLATCLVVTDLLEPDESDADLLAGNFHGEAATSHVAELRSWGFPVMSFTDRGGPIRMRPDVAISCHPFQRAESYTDVRETQFLLGPGYFVLGHDFVSLVGKGKLTLRRNHAQVLCVFGGSDLYGFSLKTARALHRLAGVRVSVVLGPAVTNADSVADELATLGVRVHRNLASVAKYMFDADLVVTTGGNTLFEVAALGSPAVVMSVRDRQNEYASFFAAEGAACNLGLGQHVGEDQLRGVVAKLCTDGELRRRMGMAGSRLVDGRGADRVIQAARELVCQ